MDFSTSLNSLDRFDAVQQVCRKEMFNLPHDFTISHTKSIHTTIQDISPQYDSTILMPIFMGRVVRLR